KNYTAISKYCNLWRNYADINRKWTTLQDIIGYYTSHQDKLIAACGPGQWNDPDMIIAGIPDFTHDQARVQMSLWSIWSAPLIMSSDLRTLDNESKEILLNKRVIAIDQDPMGKMGRMVLRNVSVYVYAKPVTPTNKNGTLFSYAVAVYNDGTQPAETEFKLSDVGLEHIEGYDLQDLWSGKMLGHYLPNEVYHAKLRPTSVDFFKATLPN
ncbi:Melibiase family protein, partial [Aphelenchoides avenae]